MPLQRKTGKIDAGIAALCALARRHRAFSGLVSHPHLGQLDSLGGRDPGYRPLISALEEAGIKLVLGGIGCGFGGLKTVRRRTARSNPCWSCNPRRDVGHGSAGTERTIDLRAWPEARVEVRIWNGAEFVTSRVTRFRWTGSTVQVIPPRAAGPLSEAAVGEAAG